MTVLKPKRHYSPRRYPKSRPKRQAQPAAPEAIERGEAEKAYETRRLREITGLDKMKGEP
jgi:hypothetical protein